MTAPPLSLSSTLHRDDVLVAPSPMSPHGGTSRSADPDWPVKYAVSRSHSTLSEEPLAKAPQGQQPNVSLTTTMLSNEPSVTSPQQLTQQQWFQVQQQMIHQQQQQMAENRKLFASPASPQHPAGLANSNVGMSQSVNTFSSPLPPQSSAILNESAISGAGSVGRGQRATTNHSNSPRGHSTAASASGRLMSLDPRLFTVDDINELLKVIEVSNQYGKEIERSVEELATLLQKKTIECEGLRKLAAENHSALADAVKNEYNSRVRVETKQANEVRDLQNKIASMRVEKDELQREVETLRLMVEQLKSTPAPLTSKENHENTLFNRLAKGVDKKVSIEERMMTTWNMPRPSQLTAAQRELVNFVGNISADVARSLQSAGSFDFLLVLCQRLCTPTNAKGDVYPEIGTTLGELLREFRMDVVSGQAGALQTVPEGRALTNDSYAGSSSGGRLSIAQQASTGTIPLVKKSARMRVIDLFLANNPQDYSQPNKVTELNKLLEENEGREEELYDTLLDLYRKRDPSASFLNRLPPNNYVYQPPQTPQNAAVAAPTFLPLSAGGRDDIRSAPAEELHLRVTLMYKKYNPSKLHTAEFKELVTKYPPETLLRALIQRYGPEPTATERRDLVKLITEGGV